MAYPYSSGIARSAEEDLAKEFGLFLFLWETVRKQRMRERETFVGPNCLLCFFPFLSALLFSWNCKTWNLTVSDFSFLLSLPFPSPLTPKREKEERESIAVDSAQPPTTSIFTQSTIRALPSQALNFSSTFYNFISFLIWVCCADVLIRNRKRKRIKDTKFLSAHHSFSLLFCLLFLPQFHSFLSFILHTIIKTSSLLYFSFDYLFHFFSTIDCISGWICLHYVREIEWIYKSS